ncbi:uncharacterized protein LOC119658614 isoform X1 [Hermetia illucens]|uniref:uncharacterized protein LOC119658614 isoform X1 n=1 Tax=Hermetia illucens TaxID=343691 RepID=UPI0018CC671F|nr:uncharacterized protein LOC119658614 isoform X1 [Hermetia illucens]XP_037922033.1 uncharacterized protein LOC119658614 isoform X1 [Hermetia illucens]XP_037922034.1 uncharacterized protein LOC119658614 isoform X1 [Hermetia illucens]
MAYISYALRRFMLTPAVRPAAALYSTAAKSTSKPTAGAEFRDLFSPKKIKKNWELAPLVIIMSGAVVGLCGYIVYASQTRDDVRFFSKTNSETTDLLNPKKRKLIIVNQKYLPMTELHEIYEEMRKAEEEAKIQREAEEEQARKEAEEAQTQEKTGEIEAGTKAALSSAASDYTVDEGKNSDLNLDNKEGGKE